MLKKIVRKNNQIFLAGGFFSECLPSAYNSLVRAVESENEQAEVILIEDLIYVHTRSGSPSTLTKLLQKGREKTLKKRFSQYTETNRISTETAELRELV